VIIYKITNSINGKVYIGQTIQKNPKMRWYDHQAKARCGVNQPLFNAIRKYSVDSFTWEVIDQANSLEELNKLEEQYVKQYNSIDEGYNIREAGGNKLHNTASIEKMREAQRNAHARRREANGGVEKMNRVLKTAGWTNSDQAKLNKSLAQRKYWDSLTTPRKLTEEHKQKVSESGKLAWVKRKQKLNGGTQN
jgi:group I intron endonuclease